MNRRAALRLLTLASASLFVGSSSAEAFTDFFSSWTPASPSTLKNTGVPPEWMKGLGPQLPAYAEYLRRAKLQNVTIRQLIEPHMHTRGSVQNTLPPRAIWGNIRSTLKVIDALADRLDLKVYDVISVYRSPSYNARCPGAKSNSFHLRNNAIDIVFKCSPGKVAAMARAMKSLGLFKGGVGRYSSFTHIDTRGNNADW